MCIPEGGALGIFKLLVDNYHTVYVHTENVLKAKDKGTEEGEEPMEITKTKKLEKDIEEELQDDYSLDLNKHKDLENEEWKYDKIPQFWEGYNVADFVDPDILKVSSFG